MQRVIMWLWFLLIVRPIVRFLIGIAVIGREHLKFKSHAIIVANHNSHLDTVIVMDLIPWRKLSRVRPVAASDYFEQSTFRRFVFRGLMNVLPIRRDRVTKGNNPLQAMCEALDQGDSILLFPEGTRGKPEQMTKFQTGIAHLIAKKPDVPVIPVFMRNLGYSLPRGKMILVPMFCDVVVGPPQTFTGSREEIMKQLTDCFTELQQKAEELRPSELPEDDR